MGGHHKKNIRKEKAKVQLKGSRLAKGTNVTKAEFKVRKIILKTQLNDTGAVRKHNVKECITKLKHNNSGIRVDTLKAIKEILGTHPDDIYPKHFGDLIQTCAQLSLELEKDVRRESFRTLGRLFETVEEHLVEPFFHVLSSYLRCAMTHLNQGIQEDSLLLLDLMLEHTPNLVAKHHEKIFEYFLDLISKMRSESKPGRTLSVNLGKKTTNVKWRCRVLERLLSILRCINGSRTEETQRDVAMEVDLTEKFTGELEEAVCLNVKRSYVEGKGSLAFLFHTDYAAMQDQDKDQATIRKCNELIIPLLNESWLETRPENFVKGPEMIVDKEAAQTLFLITAIMTELWTITVTGDADYSHDVMQRWFRETFTKDFYQLYLADFPHRFQQFDARQQDIQMNPIALNVSIAHLFCQLTVNLGRTEEMLENAGNVLDLLIKTVNQKLKHLDEFTVDLLMRTIRCAVLHRLNSWRRAGNGSILKKIKHLISCLVKAAITLNNRGAKEKIAVFLSEIILHNEVYTQLEDVVQEWVVHLPQTLLQPEISIQLMDTLLRLGTRKNEQFLTGIRMNRKAITDNLKGVNIASSTNVESDRRKLNGILYWLEPVTV